MPVQPFQSMILSQNAGEGAIGNPSESNSIVWFPLPFTPLAPAPAYMVWIYEFTVHIISEAFDSCISQNYLQGKPNSSEMFS